MIFPDHTYLLFVCGEFQYFARKNILKAPVPKAAVRSKAVALCW